MPPIPIGESPPTYVFAQINPEIFPVFVEPQTDAVPGECQGVQLDTGNVVHDFLP
nr:MAG TPA: hypothetical protein [Caudoviricetes sp.]